MSLNVAELIAELEKIEDKTLPVRFYADYDQAAGESPVDQVAQEDRNGFEPGVVLYSK